MISVEQVHKKNMEKHRVELHKILSAKKDKGMNIKEFFGEGNPSELTKGR
jgi:hypothetical protein